MKSSGALTFLLVTLFAFVLISFVMVLTDNRAENYFLFAFILLLFATIYSVTLLEIRITGNYLGIERAKNEALAARDDVVALAKTLYKIVSVLGDGAGRFGGLPKEHKDMISKYKSQLHEQLGQEIDADAEKDIRSINDAISERNQANGSSPKET